MSGSSLDRFVKAQDDGEYETALTEMKSGQKRSHWIWYVFPQLAGIADAAEAILTAAEAQGAPALRVHNQRAVEVTREPANLSGVPVAGIRP